VSYFSDVHSLTVCDSSLYLSIQNHVIEMNTAIITTTGRSNKQLQQQEQELH
jgi:hypothetical protein